MAPPPGISFIGRRLPSIVIPPLITYGVLRWLEHSGSLVLPTWGFVSLILLAKPVEYTIATYLQRIRHWREAKKRGAQTVPHIREPWPYFAGLSTIPHIIDRFLHGYVLDMIPPWQEKYGHTFLLHLPSEPQIWTMEPEHIKAMLATQFDNFEKGRNSIQQLHSFLGAGVFNSDGEMWKFHRAITRPFFSKDRISDFDIFDKHAEITLSLAKARLAEGFAIDFQDLVSRFTLDSAGQFLFGANIDSLSAGILYPPNSGYPNPPAYTLHPSNIFVNAFLNGLNTVTMRVLNGPEWPLKEFWKDAVQPHRDVVDTIIEPIMDKVLQERAESGDGKEGADHGGETLLQHLVSQTQDRRILKDELLNLLVAGRDTTACTLTFSLYMLAQHPEIANRLRGEIIQKVGEKGRPSYEDIREMKFLRAFINEVLRLYPPVPFNVRRSIKDTVFTTKAGADPLFIPGDTQIGYSIWNMHRRKDLWGPDAEEFDPDRFLDDRLHKYLTPNPFIFMPFNAGPRICLGQQFAYHEASFFLVRLLQQFSVYNLALDAQPPETLAPASWAQCEGTKGKEKLWPGTNLTLFMKGGLWVRME